MDKFDKGISFILFAVAIVLGIGSIISGIIVSNKAAKREATLPPPIAAKIVPIDLAGYGEDKLFLIETEFGGVTYVAVRSYSGSAGWRLIVKPVTEVKVEK